MRNEGKAHVESKADALFGLYYALGLARSLEKLHRDLADLGLKISLNSLKSYSSRFGWQQRVRDVDAKLAQGREEDQIRSIAEMNARHIRLGQLMQTLASKRFARVSDAAEELTIGETGLLAERGVKVERAAHGEATDRQNVVIQLHNIFIEEVVRLFREVNELPDQHERLIRFVEKGDQILEEFRKTDGRP